MGKRDGAGEFYLKGIPVKFLFLYKIEPDRTCKMKYFCKRKYVKIFNISKVIKVQMWLYPLKFQRIPPHLNINNF